jgi:hypothetical protein
LYALEAASCSLRLRSDWHAAIESSKPCAEATGANTIGCVRATTSESGLVRESRGRESIGRVSMGRESTILESVKGTNPVLRRSMA